MSSLATLEYLLNTPDHFGGAERKKYVVRFLNSELKQHNTNVLEYFFNVLNSDPKMSELYCEQELFEIVLGSRWDTAYTRLAQHLSNSPFNIRVALDVFAPNDHAFEALWETFLYNLQATTIPHDTELYILENLAGASITNDKPEIYNWCYQRSFEIDPMPPFESAHSSFCEQAVSKGVWWALDTLFLDSKSHVFYKTFLDASVFAPVSVLEKWYQKFPDRFLGKFGAQAAETLCKRERTAPMFELIAKIVLKNAKEPQKNPENLWLFCQDFIDNPLYKEKAQQIADIVWDDFMAGSGPYFLIARVLRNVDDVKNNIKLFQYVSEKHPNQYAEIFQPHPRFQTRLSSLMADELLFSVNERTDRLIVENGYDTDKINALREKMHIDQALGAPASKSLSLKKM